MPKDGPSAGVTMFSALVSLLTGIHIRHDVAMTGEITLRGRVLPVGGIKEKVLAAHRAGIRRIVLPERNRVDLEEVPKEIIESLDFIFVTRMDQVLEAALESLPTPIEPKKDDKPAEAVPN
jgi:ATP-dependent Lon protease